MLDYKTYYINTFFQYLQFVKQENIFFKTNANKPNK